jgi:hypothetical protein
VHKILQKRFKFKSYWTQLLQHVNAQDKEVCYTLWYTALNVIFREVLLIIVKMTSSFFKLGIYEEIKFKNSKTVVTYILLWQIFKFNLLINIKCKKVVGHFNSNYDISWITRFTLIEHL